MVHPLLCGQSAIGQHKDDIRYIKEVLQAYLRGLDGSYFLLEKEEEEEEDYKL